MSGDSQEERGERSGAVSREDERMRSFFLAISSTEFLPLAVALTMVLRVRGALHESKVPRGLQQQHQLQVAIT